MKEFSGNQPYQFSVYISCPLSSAIPLNLYISFIISINSTLYTEWLGILPAFQFDARVELELEFNALSFNSIIYT